MQFIITVPDAQVVRVRDGFCGYHNYQSTIQNEAGQTVPNPETKANFLRRMLINYMKSCVCKYEIAAAHVSTTTSVTTDIDAIAMS